MRDIQSDIGVIHALLSEHMAGVTLTIFKKNNIDTDINKITELVHEIYNEHLQDKPLTEVLLISQILLQEVYTKINTQALKQIEGESKKKTPIEFLAGYC